MEKELLLVPTCRVQAAASCNVTLWAIAGTWRDSKGETHGHRCHPRTLDPLPPLPSSLWNLKAPKLSSSVVKFFMAHKVPELTGLARAMKTDTLTSILVGPVTKPLQVSVSSSLKWGKNNYLGG